VVTAESNKNLNQDAYLTTGQVAKILHVSPKTVARWATEGKIPHLVTLGGHRRFPATAVRQLARHLHFAR
jgi:excisionase family DNA binding protein